ncbi:MAG: hypothetical protein PHP69_02785 [Candidatus Omnitrophica bacterium]|nr:hypothetical protein [Candidatus Omnitrophota bacterium]
MVIIIEPALKEIKITYFNNKNPLSSGNLILTGVEESEVPNELLKILEHPDGKERIDAICFKIAFGGDIFSSPAKIDKEFLKKFLQLIDFSPLYISFILRLLKAFVQSSKKIPLIAFFDTSFFNCLPKTKKYYSLPWDIQKKNNIKKYGFHGLYHKANSDLVKKQVKLISIILDKQSTVCAIKNNKPYSISLGRTPLEGIMSQTSCGDVDLGMILFLMKNHGFSLYQIDQILKNESGFFGITGYNLSVAELTPLYGKDKKITLAFKIYESQILKYIGEALSILEGIDEIIFSGSYTKDLTQIIYNLVKQMSFMGITLSETPWDTKETKTIITTKDSKVKVTINRTNLSQIIFNELKRTV